MCSKCQGSHTARWNRPARSRMASAAGYAHDVAAKVNQRLAFLREHAQLACLLVARKTADRRQLRGPVAACVVHDTRGCQCPLIVPLVGVVGRLGSGFKVSAEVLR